MKNNSARKKLIPAAAMLAVSAAMLATSTYAWFTMNKEVSVTGVNMTATVPAGLQLSLGYNQSTGTLTASTSGDSDGALGVKAPANTDDSADWTNTVDFKSFYGVARLKPASSNTGATIYTTNDATTNGKTVSATGTSITATPSASTSIATAYQGHTLTVSDSVHEGYYVDFPVWIRSSESNDVSLSVKATVSQATEGTQTNKLYKAARVSILTGSTMTTSAGVIVPYDSKDNSQGAYYSEASENGDKKALSADNAALGSGGARRDGAAYAAITAVTQTIKTGDTWTNGTTIVSVPCAENSSIAANTYTTGHSTDSATNYGDAVCVTVRVWLEGEDTSCWNATAGQDFSINLEFTEVTP